MSWDIPRLEVPEPATRPASSPGRAARPTRRLAATLAFATLFFAGAALSAGAGDAFVNAIESEASTATGETTEISEEEVSTVAEPREEGDDAETPGGVAPVDDEPGNGGSEMAPFDEGEQPPSTEPDTPGDQPDSVEDDEAENPAPQAGGDSDHGPPLPEPEGNDPGSRAPLGPPLIGPDAAPAAETAGPDPEISDPGSRATVWLHRTMPDPTPTARRLVPAFARMLRREAVRAHGDWALVLGVLRADGRVGRKPASQATVRRLATRLGRLGARRDEWAAVLALRGRTTFADRAVAGARLHRAVGLQALVVGLDAARPALERRTLADRRISIYAGGRADVVAHRIDVRVLVAIRYLAEAFGQVTVSSLQSGHRLYARPGVVSAHIYGLAVDIAALGGLSMVGNQSAGSITEEAVRAILLLPPGLHARQVISLIGMGGASFAMSNHYDHIHIGF